MTSSSASSSKYVASRRQSVFLVTGSMAAVVFVVAGVVCWESVVAHRKSGVAVVDETFPVLIGPRQDGDEGDGGLTERDRARGPLPDPESSVIREMESSDFGVQ